jgi:cytochrome c
MHKVKTAMTDLATFATTLATTSPTTSARRSNATAGRLCRAFLVAAGMALAAFQAHAEDIGKRTFEQCIACHSLTAGENGLGPSLHQVIGRTAGTLEGFRFSGPMKRSGIVWNTETLTSYLRNPQEAVPGTRMPFSGISDEATLKALVGWLETATR